MAQVESSVVESLSIPSDARRSSSISSSGYDPELVPEIRRAFRLTVFLVKLTLAVLAVAVATLIVAAITLVATLFD
jgi:hypothetical protein